MSNLDQASLAIQRAISAHLSAPIDWQEIVTDEYAEDDESSRIMERMERIHV